MSGNNQKIHRRFSIPSLNAHSENLDPETVPVFTMKHELKERVDSSVCQKLKFCCFFHHFWREKEQKQKLLAISWLLPQRWSYKGNATMPDNLTWWLWIELRSSKASILLTKNDSSNLWLLLRITERSDA